MKKLIIALLIFASPLAAYVTLKEFATDQSIVEMKWPKGTLAWQMNSVQGAVITGARTQETALQAAFAAWQGIVAGNLTFAEGTTTAGTVKPGFDNINLITTNVTPAEYLTFCPPGTLACTTHVTYLESGAGPSGPVFAGQNVDSDILFNPAPIDPQTGAALKFNTTLTTPATDIDFQSVATHEIGHLLGLDHTTIVSSTMFWTVGKGASYPRVPSSDDTAGLLSLYPTAAFNGKGTMSGTVRTTANATVFGAVVTVVNANGQPVASALTDPNGRYTIRGLDAGSYQVYAEPLDGPIQLTDVPSFKSVFPNATTTVNFTTRFR